MRKILFLGIVYLSVSSLLFFSLVSCGGGTSPHYSEEKYQRLIEKGDQHFAQMHLMGWRQAEAFYADAYHMKATVPLRDKRLLCLGLMALREKDESIIDTSTYQKMDSLGLDAPSLKDTPKLQILYHLAGEYRKLPITRDPANPPRSRERHYIHPQDFDLENSPLDLYLYLYFINYYSFDPRNPDDRYFQLVRKLEIPELLGKYAAHPLFVYFNYRNAGITDEEIEKKYPDFAEFFLRMADRAFRKKKYRRAFKYYRKALKGIPDYTRAINGIANIYFFTVKNYEEAIAHYDRTLALHPTNAKALFGKGVSLHHLDRLDLSNEVLEYMLKNQSQHHGEAYYFLGYNLFQAGKHEKAREMVEKAREFIPQSGEVSILSGRLYLRDKLYVRAEGEFLRSLRDREVNTCDSLYYLGRLNLRFKNWNFFYYYQEAIGCLQQTQERFKNDIDEVEKLDIDNGLKKWMREDRNAKYEGFKLHSDARIWQMQDVLNKNHKNKPEPVNPKLKRIVGEGNTPLHVEVLNGNLTELGLLLDDGAFIDSRNRDGQTPFYLAVMLGHVDTARFLLRRGAYVNARVPNGYIPLHEAAYLGNIELVRLLLDNGADVYSADDLGKYPLDLAVQQRHPQTAALLKPLHRAVASGNLEAVEERLNKNPGLVRMRDENGHTPFYLAVLRNNTRMASRLISYGAEVNLPDSNGFTPLYRASRSGNRAMMELLTSHGAAPADADMLAQHLNYREAFIWHVGRGIWLLKTRGHFIVFNFIPRRRFFNPGSERPLIYSGYINPVLIKNYPVYNFISFFPPESLNLKHLTHWGAGLPNRYFITGNSDPVMEGFECIPPPQSRQVGAVKVQTVDNGLGVFGGAGFLVEVDGLVVFYAGDIACGGPELAGPFVKSIKALKGDWDKIDIAILPFHGSGAHCRNKESLEFVKAFQPKIVFPMYAGSRDNYYYQLAAELDKSDLESSFHFTPAAGYRFLYKNNQIQTK